MVYESLVVQLCLTLATPWTITHQAPLAMEFSRQEYWSGLPCPSPGDLPNLGLEPRSPALRQVSCIGSQILHQLSHQGRLKHKERYKHKGKSGKEP